MDTVNTTPEVCTFACGDCKMDIKSLGEWIDHIESKKHKLTKDKLSNPHEPHTPGKVIKCPECGAITDQMLESHCKGSFHGNSLARTFQLLGKTEWLPPHSLQIPDRYTFTPRDPDDPESPLVIKQGMLPNDQRLPALV